MRLLDNPTHTVSQLDPGLLYFYQTVVGTRTGTLEKSPRATDSTGRATRTPLENPRTHQGNKGGQGTAQRGEGQNKSMFRKMPTHPGPVPLEDLPRPPSRLFMCGHFSWKLTFFFCFFSFFFSFCCSVICKYTPEHDNSPRLLSLRLDEIFAGVCSQFRVLRRA